MKNTNDILKKSPGSDEYLCPTFVVGIFHPFSLELHDRGKKCLGPEIHPSLLQLGVRAIWAPPLTGWRVYPPPTNSHIFTFIEIPYKKWNNPEKVTVTVCGGSSNIYKY